MKLLRAGLEPLIGAFELEQLTLRTYLARTDLAIVFLIATLLIYNLARLTVPVWRKARKPPARPVL
ncbi:MAG: hypothetical protein K2W95_11990 [Candidatus Obscuribacterales bacterium]|nr:hypothetical protein [Candidatus Obscuribacterales bacterium]